ncbi:hypothetical protein N8072_01210 [bacterium]|nr:hypothetical protein [bacterium]MDB4128520.1 hypothetical protein [bacterium]MDC1257280.1 hypothetical protein [bacterium]
MTKTSFAEFVDQMNDKNVVELFNNMGIEVKLDSERPLAFEDVEQYIIDHEFDDEDGILIDE